ncbi:efflux RND transporter periplasmic adaptor subunit [Thalassolituus sp. C2-1]|uniref:efflux RND transporter periplasmic adaptor subunit n=1 Tax=Venatorbacter sp. C2-1 TaxID=2597518 RepID=UPI00118F8C80|nr:efflux RND transporter periplasmic adaptor subunit [Thalassolituus sp. C2-1]TVV42711.1 efflux RND transporter periplasmic adaptor subunit [Thalassolituus sp. C2-1]
MTMKQQWPLLLALAVGTGLGAGLMSVQQPQTEAAETQASAEPQPLYWVAPMDPNYRRPEPGLSPMGMELVPVYADDNSGAEDAPGTIRISPAVEQNLGVQSAAAERVPLVQQALALAEIQVNPQYEQQIQVRSEGWISRQQVFAVGERVSAGQTLFEFYSPRIISAQEELLGALEARQPALIRAAESRLLALGVDAGWLQQLRRDRKVRQQVAIVAPQDGVITQLNLMPGARVMPEQALLRIADLSRLWVDVRLPGSLAGWLSAGDRVVLQRRDGVSAELMADSVYPLLNSELRSQTVRLQLDNQSGNWRPGDFAQAQLQKQSEPVLQVPRNALIDDGVQPRVVLALGDGRFRSQAVMVGRTGQDNVEILRGLKEGQQVVTSAQFMLDSESAIGADLSRFDDEVDHSQMDHSQMDHSQMDHSQMDHSQMDHSNMDHSNMDHSNMDHSNMDHSNMDHSNMDHSNMDHSNMDHSNMDHSNMDHSNMDHSNMDHSNMDHSNMDHSQMNHEQMESDNQPAEVMHDHSHH